MDLRLGDCLEGLKGLADKSVDHVICDPPYEAEAHTLQRRTKDAKNGHNARTEADGSRGRLPGVHAVSFDPITDEVRCEVAAQMARVTRRWMLVFCQAEAVAAWRAAFNDAGAKYRRPMVWVKPDAQPQLTGDCPGMGYETIVAAHAVGLGRSRWNAGGKVGVYVYNKNSDEQGAPRLHPTQKPLALMAALVSDFTDPGELVCDPFAGSGTTAVACKRLGRSFIGWEKDPKFHAAAVKRIENAREQYVLPMRGPKPKQAKLI
jgi:site-specific DNA-methyltransferase (adenine-specific)